MESGKNIMKETVKIWEKYITIININGRYIKLYNGKRKKR
jgi:hypothetical protein